MAGFILAKSGPTFSANGEVYQKYREDWELRKSVDIDLMKPLYQYAALPWNSDWAGW